MSLEPLRITGGRTFADGLATIAAFMGIAPGFALPPYTILLFDTSAPIGTRLLYLTLNLACILSFVLIGPLLIGLALGRPHTGGGRSRFFRYQLGAVGFGAGLGFGFTPAMLEAPTAWWITGITTGILVGGLSLLLFRTSGHQTLRRPPPAAPRHRLGRRDRRRSLEWGHGLQFRASTRRHPLRRRERSGAIRSPPCSAPPHSPGHHGPGTARPPAARTGAALQCRTAAAKPPGESINEEPRHPTEGPRHPTEESRHLNAEYWALADHEHNFLCNQLVIPERECGISGRKGLF